MAKAQHPLRCVPSSCRKWWRGGHLMHSPPATTTSSQQVVKPSLLAAPNTNRAAPQVHHHQPQAPRLSTPPPHQSSFPLDSHFLAVVEGQCLTTSPSVIVCASPVLALYGIHASYRGVQAATKPCDRFYFLSWNCDPPKGSSKFGAIPTKQCGQHHI